MTAWHIEGDYFESCNCDAICPCRMIGEIPGGRSTYGVCYGALSWRIDDGRFDEVDVSGLATALVIRYDDDEPGSPWSWVLYLDERGSAEQREALEAIFTGRLGGDAETHFPWVWKPSDLLAVRPVAIELNHSRRRQLLRIRDQVTVRIQDRYPGDEAVTCVIPGHDRDGEELVASELRVDDGPLAFDYEGTCGYAATFSYSGA